MKYTPFILFLIVSLFIACSGGLETIENTDENGNVIEVYTRDKITFAKQGTYLKYDEAGTIIEEAQFNNDTLNGKRILYYENGKPHIVENYKMGNFTGLYQAYYESGALEISGKYSDGAMNGEWIRNYENGQQMERVLFENNQENGPFTEWHKNGKLKAKGQYLDGDKEHGELLLYDKSGKLERKMNCDKGICRTSWQRDSTSVTKDMM